jgi:hypothetical protein
MWIYLSLSLSLSLSPSPLPLSVSQFDTSYKPTIAEISVLSHLSANGDKWGANMRM